MFGFHTWWPFRVLTQRWRLLLPLLAVAAFVPVVGACTSQDLPTITAQLVAPPGVPPSPNRGPAHVVVNLTAEEVVKEIAPGVTYDLWTFNGSVPGPLIRVREGDTVEIRLNNPATSMMAHSIDLHAVNGPGGGSLATTVNPGQTGSFTFRARVPGLFVYHCASGIVADHIANGMYGGILVEPVDGMPSAADKEFYVGQSEFYTAGARGAQGLQQLDYTKLLSEDPTYVVFNGNTQSLVGGKALQAKAGQTVRLLVVNGGPNLISSFHVIGEIFDKAWEYGSLETSPLRGVQTVLVPPGGALIAQFQTDVPGDYKLVDHAISRVSLGAMGILHVTGPADPGTFNPLGITGASPGGETSTATATATEPPAAPTVTSTAPPATATQQSGVTSVTMIMKDFSFSPDTLTVSPGERIAFDLQNQGVVPHNLSFADASGNFASTGATASAIISGGQSTTFTWTAPTTPGVYKFRCDVHPTQMTGTVTVK